MMILIILFLTYGYGEFIKFDSGSEIIMDDNENEFIVNFQGVFQNIPQVIFSDTLQTISKETFTNQHVEFSFTLLNVTTTYFAVKIESSIFAPFTYIQFDWTAVDDQRIEVINVFNQTSEGSQNFKFSHKNRNALQGFISLISFGFKESVSFDVEVQIQFKKIESITSDSVIVDLTTNANLLQLGYQIILGTTKSFVQSKILIKKALNDIEKYSYENLEKHIISVYGLDYPKIYHEGFKNFDEPSYERFVWDLLYQNLKFQSIMISLPVPQKFIPFVNTKMRVSKKESKSKEVMKLRILELNQEFTTPTEQLLDIDRQIQELNILISFKCQDDRQIQGRMLKCLECDDQYIDLLENCYGSTNEINFNVRFTTQEEVYSQIKVKASQKGFKIQQPILNQNREEYLIGQFNIIN